jgi:hypothetical protein
MRYFILFKPFNKQEDSIQYQTSKIIFFLKKKTHLITTDIMKKFRYETMMERTNETQ